MSSQHTGHTSAYPSTSQVIFERLAAPSDEVYGYAVSAYRTLFSHLIPNASVPLDLQRLEETYCTPGVAGCFIVARAASPSTSLQADAHQLDAGAPSNPQSKDQDHPAPNKRDIMGIIAYRPYIRRFPHPSLQYPSQRTVEVVRLFVSPQYRGQRLAQRLISELVAAADYEGIEVLYLHTQPFLTGAERLWGKMGWRVVEREEDGVWDTIHMERRLR